MLSGWLAVAVALVILASWTGLLLRHRRRRDLDDPELSYPTRTP